MVRSRQVGVAQQRPREQWAFDGVELGHDKFQIVRIDFTVGFVAQAVVNCIERRLGEVCGVQSRGGGGQSQCAGGGNEAVKGLVLVRLNGRNAEGPGGHGVCCRGIEGFRKLAQGRTGPTRKVIPAHGG